MVLWEIPTRIPPKSQPMLLLTFLKTTMPKTQYSTVCIIQQTWVSTKTFAEHSHLCALMILLWLSIAACSNQCSMQMDAAMLAIVDHQSRPQHQHCCCSQQQSYTAQKAASPLALNDWLWMATCLSWTAATIDWSDYKNTQSHASTTWSPHPQQIPPPKQLSLLQSRP